MIKFKVRSIHDEQFEGWEARAKRAGLNVAGSTGMAGKSIAYVVRFVDRDKPSLSLYVRPKVNGSGALLEPTTISMLLLAKLAEVGIVYGLKVGP